MIATVYHHFCHPAMRSSSLALPLVLIITGAIWFLKTTNILPATATLIAIGLAVLGAVVLVADGINTQSVVVGPMLMYSGAAIYAKHTYWLGLSPLLAVGMMLLGGLLLLSRSSLVADKHARPPQAPQ